MSVAVATWIVGQWVNIHAILLDRVAITLESEGLIVRTFTPRINGPPSKIVTSPTDEVDESIEEVASHSAAIGFPGWSYYNDYRAHKMAVAVHHWLIVTIFVLLYGALTWVYRKRQTEETTDA